MPPLFQFASTGRQIRLSLLNLGMTAVFVGYLSVWLPGPGAGLSFLGVELGEWIKFLGVGQNRNLFYLPPITLGLTLAVFTMSWERGRWQNWAARGTAVAVSLLAFPAIEAIRFEPQSEWLLRLELIGVVAATAVLGGVTARPQSKWGQWLPWVVMALLGVIGALWPTWIYMTIRPVVSQAVGQPIGIGLGVWLNGLGHLLIAAVSLWELRFRR
ncbi:MAG: hypothetical protein ACE5E7_00035 [Anaerolineae bacterium]